MDKRFALWVLAVSVMKPPKAQTKVSPLLVKWV